MQEKLAIQIIIKEMDKKKLMPFPLDELSDYRLMPGHLFYKRKKGDPIALLQAGDAVFKEFIDKYKKKGVKNFHMMKISDDNDVEKVKKFFLKLKKDEEILELYEYKKYYIRWFKSIYWNAEEKGNLLNLVLGSAQAFLKIDEDVLTLYKNSSLILMQRSFKIAAFSVHFAVILGHIDFNFLSDIYHICFFLDWGMIDHGLSNHIINACEEERKRQRGGQELIRKDLYSSEEIEVFLNHQKSGHDIVTRKMAKYFNFPEVIDIILKHHPYSLTEYDKQEKHNIQLEDYEALIILLDRIFPYDDYPYLDNDGVGALKKEFQKINKTSFKYDTNWKNLIKKISDLLEHE